ncbi:hypothetical protein PN419_00115 [Halorubrum ezzemoulense]|nr:hypothetical protein [Halorubrum ezzemoulense]MDB9247411.1 hypothetical protein [Halorubrum ezzemoulense]MDB9258680.1 hypothetical protein [Halorubrum ezzemoulense]MDB9264462.1 hypothetical protein [Halorubrum ezzemoulense]MDB9269041.1 hypothetical protein [Halorubrum ezzemoulense]MDB9271430.1 hypothetical protein [Halorubrum ezzemoulense]
MRSVCARCGTTLSVKAGVIRTNEYGEQERVCDGCDPTTANGGVAA